MCANCAAQGSSVVIGAVAASRALGRDAVYWLVPARWRHRHSHTPRVREARLTSRSAPFRYVIGLATYVAVGVRWPQLLDPVLGPLYLIMTIWVIPNWAVGFVARLRASIVTVTGPTRASVVHS